MSDAGAEPQSPPGVPGPHLLRSALRAARVIDDAGTPLADARISYSRSGSDGIYRQDDLVHGEALLLAAHLLREEQGVLYPVAGLSDLAEASDEDGREALLAALLENRPPLWLSGAVGEDEVLDELIPSKDLQAMDASLDPQLREDLLLRLGQRFDDKAARIMGELAEAHVLAACKSELEDAGRSDLALRVRQVSLQSDALGYDVTAPTLDGNTRRLEVKGSRVADADSVRLFISRNEANRGLKDSAWSLVVCPVSDADEVELLGWCSGPALAPFLPKDPPDAARWASVEIQLPVSILEAGLPPMTDAD